MMIKVQVLSLDMALRQGYIYIYIYIYRGDVQWSVKLHKDHAFSMGGVCCFSWR